MKRFIPLLVVLACFCFVVNSCSKSDSETTLENQDAFVSQAQQWVKETTNMSDQVDWGTAAKSPASDRVSYLLRWSHMENAGVPSYRRLVVSKGADGKLNGKILEIAQRIDSSIDKRLRNKKENFTGTVIVYDLNLRFINGGYYEQGVYRHPVSIQKFKSRADYLNTIQLALITCSWVQSSYLGDDGVFTVVNTRTCVSDGSPVTGGGDSGGDMSDNPYEEGDGPVPDDFEATVEDTYLITCPDAFTFVPVTTNNLWQEAVMTNIYCNLIFVGRSDGVTKVVTIPQLHFGIPYYSVEGNLLFTPNEAKAIAADALNMGEFEMRQEFKKYPNTNPDELTKYWIQRTEAWMRSLTNGRGKVDKTGSLNPSQPVPPKPYRPC